jgi:hypothetical protein
MGADLEDENVVAGWRQRLVQRKEDVLFVGQRRDIRKVFRDSLARH